MDDYYKWMMPRYANATVKEKDSLRIKVAHEQDKMIKVGSDMIIRYTMEFLNSIGMSEINVLKINLEMTPIKWGFYTKIMKDNQLYDKRDIIWMKFTTDGYLGVVATGSDINFNENNTSGKIIKALNKKWNDKYVLVFPLKNIKFDRHLIESGIGNYLISKKVPILDYYSHNL